MLKRVLFIVASLLFSNFAFALGKPYTQDQFDAAMSSGKPILVAVHADWCPTCKAQDPMLSELLKQEKYKNFVTLRVDYDAQKPVVQHFKVPMQSTLLVFKAGKEVGRSTGETHKEKLAELMDKGL